MLDRTAEPIDFRKLIGTLGLPGGGLDPADPNAHHLPSGLLLTADGPEAEIATPPVPLTGRHAHGRCRRGPTKARPHLVSALPLGFGIEGYSTHLNVAVRGDVVAIATLFARRFSVGMMLMLDRGESPGLLVRPRPGRLELGGDFAEGEQLRAALTFAAAARACGTAVRDDAIAGLPPASAVESSRQRTDPVGSSTVPRSLATSAASGRDTSIRDGRGKALARRSARQGLDHRSTARGRCGRRNRARGRG